MRYEEFRTFIKQWNKFSGCKAIPRSPLINTSYPGTFNLSFAEYPMLQEYGKYQYFDHDFCFSTVQLVVRPNDIFKGLCCTNPTHLGVFEMADVHGCLCGKERSNLEKLQREQVKAVMSLLVMVGIESKRIYPKLCAGGAVKELTKGKYQFPFTIPKDIYSYEAFLEAGVPRQNLRLENTRDTLLALVLDRPIAWGYRVEVEVDIGLGLDQLLDVATLEYFVWDPIYQEGTPWKNIVGLNDISYTLALTVSGIERLYMASNKLQSIYQVDYLKEFHHLVHSYNGNLFVGECLRALHAICSDITLFQLKLSTNKRYMMNKMARNITLNEGFIRNALEIISKTQSWYPELKDGIEPTIEFIEHYRQRTEKS